MQNSPILVDIITLSKYQWDHCLLWKLDFMCSQTYATNKYFETQWFSISFYSTHIHNPLCNFIFRTLLIPVLNIKLGNKNIIACTITSKFPIVPQNKNDVICCIHCSNKLQNKLFQLKDKINRENIINSEVKINYHRRTQVWTSKPSRS